MECRICHCPDPGNHNAESSCRACAAFFRRTVQLKLRYRCRKLKNCKITKDNRFFCRFCRFQRCVEVGMSCSEDPNFSVDFHLDESSSSENLPFLLEDVDFYSTRNVFHDNTEFTEKLRSRIKETLSRKRTGGKSYPFRLSLCQQAMVAFETFEGKWPNCSRENVVDISVFNLSEIMRNTYKALEFASDFCMDFDSFASLPLDQKILLGRRFESRFLHLERVFATVQLLGTDLDDTRTVYHDGSAADCRYIEMDLTKTSKEGEEETARRFLNGLEDVYVEVFLKQFKRLNPDRQELMYLILFTLWDTEGEEVAGLTEETLRIAEEIRIQLSEELFVYYKFERRIPNYAGRIYKMHNLFSCLDRMEEFISQEMKMLETFDVMKINVARDLR